jgi:hypothetical protein
MIGDGIGPGVARTQRSTEGLAGRVGKTEHRVEAPPTLVVGAGPFLLLATALREHCERRRPLPFGELSPYR